jgi:hypothetical protein
MGTQRGQMKGALSCLVRWSFHAGTRDFCPAWDARVSSVQNIFFLTIHYFNFFVPIAQQAGHAVVQSRLSFHVCLWFLLLTFHS